MAMTVQRSGERQVSVPVVAPDDRSGGLPMLCIPPAAATPEGFAKWLSSSPQPPEASLVHTGKAIRVDLGPWGRFSVPTRAFTLKGFLAWNESRRFPERGRITFINGEILIDMSGEAI